MAAIFAGLTYSRKPKLRVALLPDSLERLRSYRGDGGYYGGQVVLCVENPGKVAAKNVVGRLRFDHGYLVPRGYDEEYTLDRDGVVTVQISNLSPSRAAEDGDSDLLQIGREFKVRVETKQSGQTKVHYRFVSDEGVQAEGDLPVTVPSLGEYSEQQLVAFLQHIKDNPRKWPNPKDLTTYLRSTGQSLGLSEPDLRRLFSDALVEGYILKGFSRMPGYFLTVTLGGERFHVPQYLELTVGGESYLDERSQD